jgi:hypothetical protein
MPLRSSPSDSYDMLRQNQPYQTPHFHNPISQIQSPKHHHSFESYHQTSSLNYGFPSSQQSLSSKSSSFANNNSSSSQESNSLSNASWGNRTLNLNEKPKHHQSSPYGEQESTLSNFNEQTTPKITNEIGNQNSTGSETSNEQQQSLKMVFKQENVSIPKSDFYEPKIPFSVENNCSLDHERNRDNASTNLNQKDDKYLTSFSPIKKQQQQSIDPNVVDHQQSIDNMKSKSKYENHENDSSKHIRDFQDNVKKENEEKEYHNFPHYQHNIPSQLDINTKPLRYNQDSQHSDYFYNFPYHDQQHNQTTSSSTPLQTQPCVLPQSTPFQPYINSMYPQKSSNLTNFEQKIPLHKYPKPADDENCKLPSKFVTLYKIF